MSMINKTKVINGAIGNMGEQALRFKFWSGNPDPFGRQENDDLQE